jgi:predicted dinucleotide-utilizing enzyme
MKKQANDERSVLLAYVASQVKESSRRIAAFKERLETDPVSALEDSEFACEAAATLRVLEIVKANLDRGQEVEVVIAGAVREAVRGARFPKRSTSPTGNLMAQCLAAAWGEVASWFRGAA